MENSNFTNVVYRLSDANPEYPLPRKSPLSFRLGNSLMLHLYRGPNTFKCDTDVSHRSLDNSFVLVPRGIHNRVWNRPIQPKSGNRSDSQPFKHITHQRHVQYHTVRIGRYHNILLQSCCCVQRSVQTVQRNSLFQNQRTR